jgi:hypothetical protein
LLALAKLLAMLLALAKVACLGETAGEVAWLAICCLRGATGLLAKLLAMLLALAKVACLGETAGDVACLGTAGDVACLGHGWRYAVCVMLLACWRNCWRCCLPWRKLLALAKLLAMLLALATLLMLSA